MPRVRLSNTIFHLRKINAKLMLNSQKNNHFFHFYYAEMRRKLWPKAPVNEGALGQISKNFQVYFINIHFLRNPMKKIYNRAKELYCDATIFVF